MESLTKIQAIRKTLVVDAPIETAFRVFTQGITGWWPLRGHSVGGERAQSVIMEGRVGGRLYERMVGGEEALWGTIRVWEPPTRIVFSWHPGRREETSQEVEMRFFADGGRTHIEFEHRGWEQLGDLGMEKRKQYDGGWDEVLGRYTEAARM